MKKKNDLSILRATNRSATSTSPDESSDDHGSGEVDAHADTVVMDMDRGSHASTGGTIPRPPTPGRVDDEPVVARKNPDGTFTPLPTTPPEKARQSAAADDSGPLRTRSMWGPKASPDPPASGPPMRRSRSLLLAPRGYYSAVHRRVTGVFARKAAKRRAVSNIRRLAGSIGSTYLSSQRGGWSCVVTSARSKEGKSLVASNLAVAFGEDECRKVILVDLNLRDPAPASDVDEAPGTSGLLEVLKGTVKLEAAVTKLHHRGNLDYLYVNPRRANDVGDPVKLVNSKEFEELLTELKEVYHVILFDTPPVLECDVAMTLSMKTEKTILVVRAERSRYPDVIEAIGMFGKDKLEGLILNNLSDVWMNWPPWPLKC